MKDLLKQLAAYNVWASQKILEVINALSEEQQTVTLPSSFPSLQKTILHMLDAENIWWQRLRLMERINRPSENFSSTTADAGAELLSQSRLWEEWVNSATEMAIEHVFEYKTFDGVVYKQPVWQMLLHVFNHGTYHRGQLVTMLRQLGVDKIPGTDFILWSRKK